MNAVRQRAAFQIGRQRPICALAGNGTLASHLDDLAALAADGLLVARPVLGTPRLKTVQRASLRKREQRLREAMERKPFTIDPRWDALCEALRRFAAASENGHSDPAVTKAVRAIQLEADGWEDDKKALGAVATSIVDEWVKRWLRDQ